MTDSYQVTATQGRQQFFDLLNRAQYARQTTHIFKNGQVVAKIMPVDEKKIDWSAYRANMKMVAGLVTKQDLQAMSAARIALNKKRFPDW